MRRFIVRRLEDVTGLSGTGVVAEGVEFSDSTVAMRWLQLSPGNPHYQRGVRATTVLHEHVESVEALHGHNGRTIVEWVD